MKSFIQQSQKLLENDIFPDFLIRFGIRRKLKDTLIDQNNLHQNSEQRINELVEYLKSSPIAVNTLEANDQHYELPTEFFKLVMGKHMKYSCGFWENKDTDFDQSESDMLRLTCERAEIVNGQSILELGCGWGSLTLFMASNFPECRIVGVSNSSTQRKYIEKQAKEKNLSNVTIITADINDFTIDKKFDRVVSVEMFEHMRNYQKLLHKVSGFLKAEGKLFVHIFTHKTFAYLYDSQDESDWIGKYFFTGGIMPSDDLLLRFDDDFEIEEKWKVNGRHYQKTSEAWLKNMDQHKQEIWKIFTETYGKENVRKWWVYWRVFFMSCAELWGYKNGTEWIVSHYRFKLRREA